MTIRKAFGLCAIAVSAAAAPVTFSSSEGVFRLQEACGQATECAASSNYICSTSHNDYKEYRCSKGCEPVAT
ncbi:MAG TPA: hypothetical protein VK358_04145 [Longimicrobium sp.]|nr:hypothetical protein [Longimicrobium sp.]